MRKNNSLSILIVEDDSIYQELLRDALSHYRLSFEESGIEAIKTFDKVQPDIVLLDIVLEDMSGHDVLKMLMVKNPNAYIIMLSGNSDDTNISAAVSNGAKGFLAKPVSQETLDRYILEYSQAQAS